MAQTTTYVPSQIGVGEDGHVSGFDFSDASIRRGFIRKVYGILMCQLLVTFGFICLFAFHEPTRNWARQYTWVVYVAMAVVFIVMLVLVCCGDIRRRTPINFICLTIFTAAMSFMLGVMTSVYSRDAVMMAVGITAVVSFALTIFAFQTKWDFTVLGGTLMSALLILIILGIFAIFIRDNRIYNLIYGSLGALVFCVYIVYDTQLMMGGKHKYSLSPEEYVFAALNLYLDIINLFLYILIIINAARG